MVCRTHSVNTFCDDNFILRIIALLQLKRLLFLNVFSVSTIIHFLLRLIL